MWQRFSNNDGVVTPWETWTGMRVLGYGIFASTVTVILVHFFLSYPTIDSWIPDPFWSIHLRNINRALHGSDTGVYDHDGQVVNTKMAVLWQKFGTDKTHLHWTELISLWNHYRNVMDPIGWCMSGWWWILLFLLAGDREGKIPVDAIRAQYDGTLFYRLEQERKLR